MQFMIIEKFREGKVKAIYERVNEKGRMLPTGVNYVSSWINETVTVCYQVMESDSADKIYEWIQNWNDLVDFEVIPVISSAEARSRVMNTGD